MISALIPKVAGMEQKRTAWRLRPSSAVIRYDGAYYGGCPRATVMDRLAIPPAPMPGRTILRLDDSTWHEELTKDWLRKTAYKLHSEQLGVDCLEVKGVTLPNWLCEICDKFYPGNLVHGHIDGMLMDLTGQDRLFEHKAIDHFAFQSYWAGKFPFNYFTQTALYIIGVRKLAEVNECILLIKNKNTAQYIDYRFFYDVPSDALTLYELEHSNGEKKIFDPPEVIRGLVTSAVQEWKENERRYQESRAKGAPVLPPRPFWISDWQCEYCLAPETPVLMADCSWRPIGTINLGDRLWSFTEYPENGKFRRMVETGVEAVYRRKAPVVAIRTEFGEIKCSTDHRWLAYSKNYTTLWCEAAELRPGWKLFLFSDPNEPPKISQDYKVGYIQGLVEGDGTKRISGWRYVRVALADFEALDRFQSYLTDFEIPYQRSPFVCQSKKPMEKVVVFNNDPLNTLLEILDIDLRSKEHAAGYLAGLFDAEGSLSGWQLRIGNKSVKILNKALEAARLLNLPLYLEPKSSDVRSLKLGSKTMTSDLVRFFSVTRPAITRKIAGLRGRRMQGGWTEILSIESGGIEDLVDLQTGSRTFIAGGLATHNCDFHFTCWEGFEKEFQSLAADASLSEEVETLCRYYLEVSGHEGEMKKEKEKLRDQIKELLLQVGAREGRAGKYVVKLRLDPYESIKKDLIPEPLREAVTVHGFKEVLTIRDSEKLKKVTGKKAPAAVEEKGD